MRIGFNHNDFFEVLLLVTVKCNCRCVFCCEQGVEQDAPMDELLNYIKPLRNLGVKIVDINGGEPLVRRNEIPLLLEKISEAGMIPSISSNLTLLNPEVLCSLKKYCKIVNCSLHGAIAETNDYLMKKPGAFEIITSNIKLLVANGIDVHVTCVVVDNNFHEVEQLATWCFENHVRSFCMNVVFGRGKGQNLLKTEKVTAHDVMTLKHKIRKHIDLSKMNIYVNSSRVGQCILLRPNGDLCGAPENPKSEKDGLIEICNVKNVDVLEKWNDYNCKFNHYLYCIEKFSPYFIKNNNIFAPVVYYSLPDILDAFRDYIELIGLVGSFAVNEESMENGKYLSDIDYYIVLKEGVKKNNLPIELFVANNKLESNYPKKSFWFVEFEDFYGGERSDSLTPFQLAETRAVLYGELKSPELLLSRNIDFNSVLGLCGVAYMEVNNGLERSDFRKIIKGIFNQIGVLLIVKGCFTTSFANRIENFIREYPEFEDLKQELLFSLELKKNVNSGIFYDRYSDCESFFNVFQDLFSMKTLNNIFQINSDLNEFFKYITKSQDVEKFIRLMHLAFYFKDQKVLDLVNEIVHFKKDDEVDTLSAINSFFYKWLSSISIFENSDFE